jgi:flagellar hook-length control protein FliK
LVDKGFPLGIGWPADCTRSDEKNREKKRWTKRETVDPVSRSGFKRWLVSGVVSEGGTVRHAHQGQAPRNNTPPAEPADHASPFTTLVEGASEAKPRPTPPPPKAAPPPRLPGQKHALRPQDGRTAQSLTDAATGTENSPQKSPPASSAPENQTAVSSPPANASQGSGSADAVPAPDASAKTAAAQDTKPTIMADAATAASGATATIATAGNNVLDAAAASSTAAAVTDIHGDKTAKADSSASGTAQPAAPLADPSAIKTALPVQQAVLAPVAAPVIPAAPATIESGSATATGNGTAGGSPQDAAQIAALGDAAKAGALNGKGDRAGAQADKSAAAPAGPGGSAPPDSGASAKPGAKIADAVKSMPSLAPQTAQDPNPPTGPGQPNAAGGPQPRSGDAASATEVMTDRARQHAKSGQAADGTAGPQSSSNDNSNVSPNVDPNADPNVDPNRAPAGVTNRIEDITRQALDTAVRHIAAPGAEITGDATSRSGGAPSGSAPASPDGSGGLIAPASLTAPTAAPSATAAHVAVPIAGLAVEIVAHAHAGKNRFEIRLDPPELGRIDVRLDVDRDGKVTSRLVVDRPQTLDILRHGAPELERSLQQAGLKTGDNALQFSLRDQGGFGSQNPYSNHGSQAGTARVIIPDRSMPPVDAATAGYGRVMGTSTGLDIRV